MKVRGRHFATGQPLEVELAAGSIQAVRPLDAERPAHPSRAAPGAREESTPLPWLAPGLVDLQINGFGGVEFSAPSLTVADVAAVAAQVGRSGVTQFLPTITTASPAALLHAARTLAEAIDQQPRVAALVAGIHLEGPYISPIDGPRGAHPREHCRPPDWDEFQSLQAAAQGRIRLVTLAPEYDGAGHFVRQLVASGVVVAIGHTAATCEQISAAVDAGARLSTHLGNGCHAVLPRHPNYLWTQLADDRLTASLIVDGHHLPPEVVQSFIRAKQPSRCILVSDLSAYAGLGPGEYATQLGHIEMLPEGKLVVAGQRQFLAGAAWPLGECVARVMPMAGVDLGTAIAMASRQPAALIGARYGGIEIGATADLVLFDLVPAGHGSPAQLTVRQTICQGQVAVA